jgi:hypothetical protein
MPNKDGTGPEGKGSKTGRQLGNCQNREHQQRPRICQGRRCRGNNISEEKD